jgi:hypothetical protein
LCGYEAYILWQTWSITGFLLSVFRDHFAWFYSVWHMRVPRVICANIKCVMSCMSAVAVRSRVWTLSFRQWLNTSVPHLPGKGDLNAPFVFTSLNGPYLPPYNTHTTCVTGHVSDQKVDPTASLLKECTNCKYGFFYATSLSSIAIKEEAWTIVHTTSTWYKRYITGTVRLFLVM